MFRLYKAENLASSIEAIFITVNSASQQILLHHRHQPNLFKLI